jgi:ADP-L-glycero-D-manno-heptose 6-epimerase
MNKILITGGSGFIGSALIWKLNQIGEKDIIIVDSFGTTDKWKNIRNLKFSNIINKIEAINQPEHFYENIDYVFHFGACSTTTQPDNDYLFENNFKYSIKLLNKFVDTIYNKKTKFIYASSSSTYGNGENGYSDEHNKLEILNPINMYGYTKQLFDLYALNNNLLDVITGLKFFNVFGPNEYHKEDMRSIICKQFETLKFYNKLEIFKAYENGCENGEQQRDFIYIKDVVDVLIFFFQNRNISGIYNVGTGIPRSWNELCNIAFKSRSTLNLHKCYHDNGNVVYKDIPNNMKNKYQNYTCADINKLRLCGYNKQFMSLEESINDYIVNYLNNDYKYLK